MLKNVPQAVGRKEYKSFGEGLAANQIKGFELKISQMAKPKKTSSGGMTGAAPQPHLAQFVIALLDYDD